VRGRHRESWRSWCPGCSAPSETGGANALPGREHQLLRLGYPQSEDVDGFGIAYGWDPGDWPGLATLVAIREVSGLSTYIRNAPPSHSPGESSPCGLARTLQAGDHSARWNRPGSAR
jgi:hypothetical protein